MFARARICGAVSSDAGGHWRASAVMVTRLARWAMRRLPEDAAQLGKLLHGLGEIDAHASAAKFAQPLIRHLSQRHRGPRYWINVLDAAAKYEGKSRQPAPLDALAFAQWISRSELDWSTFLDAESRIERPYAPAIHGRFGLKFVAQIVLAVDPRSVDDWIAKHSGAPMLAVLGSAAVNIVFANDGATRVASLLGSRTPAIQCLGAAALVCPHPFRPALSYCDAQRALVAGGISAEDAVWMMGLRIKNLIHQRYGLEYTREQCEARSRYIELKPDAAIGGARNADAELRSLRAQRDRAAERYVELLPELETMLSDMAAGWPEHSLSAAQMANLNYIFVETPEIRYRLAKKLSPSPNRDELLKQNIAQLEAFIGLENLDEVPKDYFYPDEKRLAIIAPWAAQSVVLLYSQDHRGIGKRTSDLVQPFADAAITLLEQPFIASRQPTTWQSVVTRSACATIFALMVVASAPRERRNELLVLNGYAIAHAYMLLRGPVPEQHPPRVFHELTGRAVHQMEFQEQANDLRLSWALAEDLSDYPRALALWSSPALVEAHTALAFGLLRRVGQMPLSRKRLNEQFTRLLTVLDTAVAACAAAGKTDLLSSLVAWWDENYAEWRTVTDRFANAAAMLAAAVTADGPERVSLLSEPDWSQSACRQWLESKSVTATSA